jgi:hypothetical protein
MKTYAQAQRRTITESSDRTTASIQPRPWNQPHFEPLQTVHHDFSHVDLFSHAPKRSAIQPRLNIGAPNDVYEQEADRVAEQVMSTPDSAVQRSVQRQEMLEEDELQMKPLAASITPLVQRETMPEEEELQAKALEATIQREAMPEEEEIQTKPLVTATLQREEVPEEEVQAKSIGNFAIQREPMPEEEEEIQTKALEHSVQREAMPEEEEIQTKRSPSTDLQAGSNLESQLNSSQGGGSPLPDEVRTFMEPRFGADFSQVRVHTGSEAVQMNRELNAQAFTHGQDIYYGAGKAPARDNLTAHELTHVVQQAGEVQTKSPATKSPATKSPATNTLQRQCPACDSEDSVQRKSVQRKQLASLPANRVAFARNGIVQRKTVTDKSTPGWEVDFTPSSAVTTKAPPKQEIKNFDGSSNRESYQVPRDSKGDVFLAANMTWKRTSSGGGGGTLPSGKNPCDFIPDQKAKDACKAASDPKAFLKTLTLPTICIIMNSIPGGQVIGIPLCGTCFALAGATGLFNNTIGKLLGLNIPSPCDALLAAAIDFIADLLPSGGGSSPPVTPPANIVNQGKASTKLIAHFQLAPDGTLQFFGAAPLSESHGTAGELLVPVAFSRDSTGAGGFVTLAPMIRSDISKQQANGETVSEVNTFQRSFEVELAAPPPPPPQKVCCEKGVGSFKIASDKLMDESGQQEELFQWYKGLDPAVRKSVETGKIPVRITGRASNTGSMAFNLELSERRTKRVRQFMLDFAGSDAHNITFSIGEFEAPPNDDKTKEKEDDKQRRVDVRIAGDVSAKTLLTVPDCGLSGLGTDC